MAARAHIRVLEQGVDSWNRWRRENPLIKADLSEACLSHMDLAGANLNEAALSRADFRGVDLRGASLTGAVLLQADLRGANLTRMSLVAAKLNSARLDEAILDGAVLSGADLTQASLTQANLHTASLRFAVAPQVDLRQADIREANLAQADMRSADLRGADLRGAILDETNLSDAIISGAALGQTSLINTDLRGATITSCSIYGISAWNVKLEGAIQSDLVITPGGEPAISVDNLEVAQFIYLLLNNSRLRQVIDSITSKVVLILGRFTPERKAVLDAIRNELRLRDYLPVIFDFDSPASRDTTEAVSTLAHMARFIIADITDPRSIPQELQRIVPDLPSVPVQPLLHSSSTEYGMFEHFRRYPWVLPVYRYESTSALLESLGDRIIAPAEASRGQHKGTDTGNR